MRSRVLFRLCSVLSVVVCASATRAQTTWYVDAAGTPPGTGTQANPYTSIQYAIGQPTTMSGDTLLVLPATYHENVDFIGKSLNVKSTADAATTIIDASFSGSVVTLANGEGPGTKLEGFTLRHGYGAGSDPHIRGGGIYCKGVSPSLMHLVIEENLAQQGSGIYLEDSSAFVYKCTIQDNQTPSFYSSGPTTLGVGVYSDCGSQPLFDHCTIRHNKWGIFGPVQAGGGVYGTGTYDTCTIELNEAFQGGGVCGASGCTPPHLIACTIRSNRTSSPEPFDAHLGGGVFGPATLTDCTIQDNIGWFAGGGVWSCTLTGCLISGNKVSYPFMTSNSGVGGGAAGSVLVDCEVRDNEAIGDNGMFYPGRGGGIMTSTATRCKIWRNKAQRGGGAANSNLINCTVYGNTATVAGGGYWRGFGSVNTVRNSIFWGNTGPEFDQDNSSPSTTVTYSDIAGGFAGTGNINSNPMLVGPLSGDFHLKVGSPCIDLGDPSMMDPDTSRIDIGAIPFLAGYCGSPGTYCVAKINSHGCSPAIGFSGTASMSGPDTFSITASQVLNQRSGLLIWSSTPATTQVLGGTLCVSSFKRTPAQNSGGTALPVINCSGTYSYFFSQAYMSAHGVSAGSTLYAQYYARDPFHSDGTGASLSNALEFPVCP